MGRLITKYGQNIPTFSENHPFDCKNFAWKCLLWIVMSCASVGPRSYQLWRWFVQDSILLPPNDEQMCYMLRYCIRKEAFLESFVVLFVKILMPPKPYSVESEKTTFPLKLPPIMRHFDWTCNISKSYRGDTATIVGITMIRNMQSLLVL